MNNIAALAPKYVLPIDSEHELYVLWFNKSNSYIIVSNKVLEFLKSFLNKTKIDFFNYLKNKGYTYENSANYYLEISQLLLSVNYNSRSNYNIYEFKYLDYKKLYKEEITSRTYYVIYGKYIQVNFPNEIIKNFVNPQLAYYEASFNSNVDYQVFDVVCDNKNVVLYLNRTFLLATKLVEMHVFLGKFSLQIFNLLYAKKEEDWLATFHASTVVKDKNAIMCIGKSGSGKSTLSALLNQNGYNVVADDITPMLASSLEVYRNPSAISIKKGAFTLLNNHVKSFNSLTTVNGYKGDIKFLPINGCPKKTYSYKCNKVVLVNFNKDNKIPSLEILDRSKGLEILISESWVSSNSSHALQFLNWINTVTFYKLTYSKTEDAIKYFADLESY
ncbi:hypothetical protein [Thalassobellus citreus]|uniref:hypothetical protein n=1 Tax=Thalassobellus citreus TaxID=3367752 RepID=UPI00378E0255